MYATPLVVLLLFSQTPDLRCGSYCLYVSLKAIDFPVASYQEVEDRLGQPSRLGYSLGQLAEVAESYGAYTLGVETQPENLRERDQRFACIAHLEPAHFVNIAKIDKGLVYVIDPPRDYEIPIDTFRGRWSGKALLISPSPLVPEEEIVGHIQRRELAKSIGLVLGISLAVVVAGWFVLRRWKAVFG